MLEKYYAHQMCSHCSSDIKLRARRLTVLERMEHGDNGIQCEKHIARLYCYSTKIQRSGIVLINFHRFYEEGCRIVVHFVPTSSLGCECTRDSSLCRGIPSKIESVNAPIAGLAAPAMRNTDFIVNRMSKAMRANVTDNEQNDTPNANPWFIKPT